MDHLNRRRFSQLLGAIGLGGFSLTRGQPAGAQSGEACPTDGKDIVCSELAQNPEADRCLYWTDAMAFEKQGLAQRAALAYFLRFPQNEQSYIDKVVLADDACKALGVRYLTPSDKDSLGFPPYIIFDQVDLAASPRYSLFFQLRTGDTSLLYKHTLTQAELKRRFVNRNELGTYIAPALERSPHQGVATHAFHWQGAMTPEAATNHLVKAQLMAVGPNDHFQVRINLLPAEEKAGHYNRFFLVTDPVGRLLGAVERSYNGAKGSFVDVGPLTESERNKWGLTQDKVAKISNCPYIMVFVDNVKAYAKTTIWLR